MVVNKPYYNVVMEAGGAPSCDVSSLDFCFPLPSPVAVGLVCRET